MQKITSVLLMSFAAVLLLAGCKKNQSNENYHDIEEPNIPVFTEKVSCTVSGFIINEQSEPVAGAVVTAGTTVTTTDAYGYFSIQSASVTRNIGLVKVVKAGFFTGFKTFIAKANEHSFFRLMLLNKTTTGTVSASAGGTISSPEGAIVVLPANGITDAASGAAYTGQVQVSVRVLPVAATSDMLLSIPGDARGLNAAGHLKSLNTYTAIAVDLNGDAGQKLQLAAGSKATVTLPIATALQPKAPATVALWSFDEEKGLWKEEGTLTKNGAIYTGQVSHFSYWSGAAGLSLVNFKAQVLNTALQPLSNVPVVLTIAGQPLNAGYGKFAFTDANGFVTGGIPANSNFVLNVGTTCSNSSYNYHFSTAGSDIDLGAVTGNLGQAMVTLTGTVTNCAGQPVADGYVQTYDHGFYNRIPVVNGSFNFTGLACNNLPVNYIAVDNNTQQQNAPQAITLVPGTNNLGVLSACGISTMGSVTYTIDGVTRTINEPAETLAGYYVASNGITAIIKISGGSGSTDFSFQFDGGMTIGSAHKVYDIWSPGYASGRAYAATGLNVTITDFGDVGGFITGNFSGPVVDFASNTPHTVNYNFRIKRLN